jgi:hypothetical protein
MNYSPIVPDSQDVSNAKDNQTKTTQNVEDEEIIPDSLIEPTHNMTDFRKKFISHTNY